MSDGEYATMMDCSNRISSLDSPIRYKFTGEWGNLNARVLYFKWHRIVYDMPFELRDLAWLI